MFSELVVALIAIVSSGATSTLTWFLARKRNHAEARIKEEEANALGIANEIKFAEYYKVMLDDLGARYEKKFQEIVGMYDKKVQMLEDEIKLLKRKIFNLEKENKELLNRLKDEKPYDNSKSITS